MALIDDAVRALASAAGWKEPRSSNGLYRFHLEKELELALFSPDNRSCVMRGEVCVVPMELSARQELLESMARRQVGVCRRRASVLALERAGTAPRLGRADEDALILFRHVPLAVGRAMDLRVPVRDFLNDFAWWKTAMSSNTSATSPFSFPGLGGSSFWSGGLR